MRLPLSQVDGVGKVRGGTCVCFKAGQHGIDGGRLGALCVRVEGTLPGGARRAKIDSFLRLWDYEIRNLRPKITPERYFS